MTDSLLSSAQNPRIKELRKLHSRKHRLRTRLLLLEGVRLIDDAWRAGIAPRQVVYAPDLLQPGSEGERLLHEMDAAGIARLTVTAGVFNTLSDTVTPQGLAAVVPLPELPFPPAPRLLLLLDRVRDPGNAGTLLRSAEAAGVDGVIIGPHSVDPWNDKVVRAAMGAHFRLPLRVGEDWPAVNTLIPPAHLCYLADAAGERDYDQVDWLRPATLIVGGEAAGASPEGRRRAERIAIPMRGKTESLNAGVAGSVILFEAARQRRRTT